MSLGCAYDDGLCSRLNERTRVNRLNERDLSLPVSAAAVFISGIDLNTAVFNKRGYTMNATNIVKDILDAGLRRLYLDVYWDTVSSTWNLCPTRPPSVPANSSSDPFATQPLSAPNNTLNARDGRDARDAGAGAAASKVHSLPASALDAGSHNVTQPNANSPLCDYSFNFDVFMSTVGDYISMSDTNIAASLLFLYLRPQLWPPAGNGTVNGSIQGSASLNRTLIDTVGSRLMTPVKVRSEEIRDKGTHYGSAADIPRTELWPDLSTVLYTDKSRLVVFYNDTLRPAIPELDSLDAVAFTGTTTIDSPANYSIDELSRMNFTDVFVSDLQGWSAARKLGVSPVLTNPAFDVYSSEMQQLLDYYEYWAWIPNDPELYTIDERKDMLSDGHIRSSKLEACAVITANGLEVANCNAHYPILCANKTDSFDWVISEDNHTYFDPDCPSGYSFSTPSTALEARYIRENLLVDDINALWADFNSLFLPNCWVTGGTNAVCPYNIRDYGRNGIGYISVAGAVAVCLVATIVLFEWDRGRSPLMKKSFGRAASREEFEGIPS